MEPAGRHRHIERFVMKDHLIIDYGGRDVLSSGVCKLETRKAVDVHRSKSKGPVSPQKPRGQSESEHQEH